MTALAATSERAIILAPLGRDSQIALMMLNEAGYAGVISRDLTQLCSELEYGAGLLSTCWCQSWPRGCPAG